MSDDQQDITQLRLTLQQAQEKMQIQRAELYRRRRQPLPPAKPEEPIQPGENNEGTKIQEALDLTRRMAQIYEDELHHMTTGSSQENSVSQSALIAQQRGCLLTGGLVCYIICDICSLILQIIGATSILGFVMSLLLFFLALNGINGIWKLQKWGYYWMVCLLVAAIFVDFFSLRPLDVGIDLLCLTFLTLLVLPRWKYME